MDFRKSEKVFSLSRTADAILKTDLTRLFSELFCYMVVTGLYLEDMPLDTECYPNDAGMSEGSNFWLINSSYHDQFAYLLQNGLKDRVKAILNHSDLNEAEKSFMRKIDGLFSNQNTYSQLEGRQFFQISVSRNFHPDMQVVAKYAGAMFGQKEFLGRQELPRLYLSKFGNIHLSESEKDILSAPSLIYGSKFATQSSQTKVTALWSLVSAVADGYLEHPYFNPITYLTGNLDNYALMSKRCFWKDQITIPRYVGGLRVMDELKLTKSPTDPLCGKFIQEFLYGRSGNIKLVNHCLFKYIVNDMVNKMSEDARQEHAMSTSIFRRVADSSTLHGRLIGKRSDVLEYALEALDPDLESDKKDTAPQKDTDSDPESDEGESEDDSDTDLTSTTDQDPATDPTGFDPSTPPPAAPAGTPAMEEDTIGLISFNKTGEGIDEDLYRDAVVALNDRLQGDDTIPVSADVKAALDQWVNCYLYRAAITATKDQITSLGLQKYLKEVN